jgi:hypothetical protein
MHPMSERAIIAAAKHTGMTPDDYKKNVIAVWDSALKDNTALREKTKAEWNKLDLELKTLSRHVAWLETGITNKGVPSSWQLSGGWVREAKGSDNAKYPFDGRNVQLV